MSVNGGVSELSNRPLQPHAIHHLPTSAYTTRSNGLDERFHLDLKNIITKLSDGDPPKWVKILPLAEFIMNSRISNSTGYSGFFYLMD